MSNDDSQKISAGWYIAFFLLGILLGLWALESFDFGETRQNSKAAAPVAPAKKEARASRKQSAAEPEQPAAVAQTALPEEPPVAATTPPAEVKESIVCNQQRAMEIRNKAREVAEIAVSGDQVTVRLRGEWAYYSDSVRRSFVAKFVDSDTCLNGTSRPIRFYYEGKPFANVEAGQGVVFE